MSKLKHLTLQGIADFLSKLAEKSNSVYWLSSPDFARIAYISPAFEEIWGRPRHILYEKPEVWIEYLHPEDAKGYHPILAMADRVAKLGPAARYEETYRIVRPSGEIRWVTDRGFPIYDEHGDCCGVTGVAVDITREKQAEDALRQAIEKAELANQIKTDFIRNMEHDIRTPFSGVYGLTQQLCNRETDPAKKEILKDIEKSAKELLDYCNNILDFSKIEFGTDSILAKPFSCRSIVESVVRIERPAARLKKLPFMYEIEEKIPNTLIGDPQRLQRILINLLGNAIKFTHEGFVRLQVKLAKQIDERHVVVRFIVEDTGIGIPADKQDIIYEKFTRLDPANRGIYKGMGLGLHVVKQLLADLGGDIDLMSGAETGSTFICDIPFRLPLVS